MLQKHGLLGVIVIAFLIFITDSECALGEVPKVPTLGKLSSEQLLENGEKLLYEEDYPNAIKYLRGALKQYQTTMSVRGQIRALIVLGRAYALTKNYNLAAEQFASALGLNHDDLTKATIQNAYADMLILQPNPNFRKAEKLYGNSLTIQIRAGDIRSQMYSLYSLGVLFINKNDYDNAISISKVAKEKAEKLNDKDMIAKILILLAKSYITTGQLKEAVSAINEAEKISYNKPSYFYSQIGDFYYYLGDKKSALENYRNCYEAARDSKKLKEQATCLVTIASVQIKLDMVDKAIESLKYAEDIQTKISLPQSLIAFKDNVAGRIYSKKEDFFNAIKYYNLGIQTAKKAGYPNLLPITYMNIADSYLKNSEKANALNYLRIALKALDQVDNPYDEAYVLAGFGNYYLNDGDTEKSITYYRRSTDIFKRAEGSLPESKYYSTFVEPVSSIYRAYANALLDKGDLKQATEIIDLVKEQELIESTGSNDLMTNYEHQKLQIQKKIPGTGNNLPKNEGEKGKKFELEIHKKPLEIKIDALKSKELSKILNSKVTPLASIKKLPKILNSKVTPLASIDPTQQWNDCREMNNCNDEKLKIIIKQLPKVPKPKIDPSKPLKQDFDSDAVLKSIYVISPKTVLIQPFFDFNKEILRVQWHYNYQTHNEIVSIKSKKIQKLAFSFVCLLQKAGRAPEACYHDEDTINIVKSSDIKNEIKRLGKELYSLLITKELQQELDKGRINSLVFCLDDFLNNFPVSALYTGNEFLIEKYYISQIFSIKSTILYRTFPIAKENNLLALGVTGAPVGSPPIRHVKENIDYATSTFSSNSSPLLDNKFTFENLQLSIAKQKRTLLYFDTHAHFNYEAPLNSYIVMGKRKSAESNEQLFVSDIPSLPGLGSVHLVVISACNSAFSLSSGKGLTGFATSFMVGAFDGGSDAVLGTIWDVHDLSTSKFMNKFFKTLRMKEKNASTTKAFALREASVCMIQKLSDCLPEPSQDPNEPTDYSNPYYWAPFILIGNWL
jgi:CHAT domain-containing protein/tetratricopeptide (TPR) repeat protein